MVDDEIGRNARLLIKNNKVKKVSDTIWEVGDEMVRRITKPGRSFFTCTCESYRRNCASSQGARCYHSEAVIIFNPEFQMKVDELIKFYKDQKELNIETDLNIIIMHLQDLKRIK